MILYIMLRRTPLSTRTGTLVPSTTLSRAAMWQNSRATSLLLARLAGAYLSSHRLPPLPTAGRWRYRMTKLPILAALAAAFLAQPATAQPASAPRTAVVAHADLDLATHKGVKTLDRRIWRAVVADRKSTRLNSSH